MDFLLDNRMFDFGYFGIAASLQHGDWGVAEPVLSRVQLLDHPKGMHWAAEFPAEFGMFFHAPNCGPTCATATKGKPQVVVFLILFKNKTGSANTVALQYRINFSTSKTFQVWPQLHSAVIRFGAQIDVLVKQLHNVFHSCSHLWNPWDWSLSITVPQSKA